MTGARAWLAAEAGDAPASLRERMLTAVADSDEPVAHALAQAAMNCLRAATADPSGPHAALDLLTADALLTHACAAAAEQGELLSFANTYDAAWFESAVAE